jgi:hypothetical protein
MADENKDLYYLHELSGYKVAEDYPDVRGWEVKDTDNRTIGKVDGLLVSKSAERVVYLDVEVDKAVIEAGHEVYSATVNGVHEFLNKEGEDHLILPIGLATLEEDNKLVYSDSLTHETFAGASRFSKGATISREFEIVVFGQYRPELMDLIAEQNNDFYNRKEFKTRK